MNPHTSLMAHGARKYVMLSRRRWGWWVGRKESLHRVSPWGHCGTTAGRRLRNTRLAGDAQGGPRAPSLNTPEGCALGPV